MIIRSGEVGPLVDVALKSDLRTPSYFQWRGELTDLALASVPQSLPPSDVTHIYSVDFATTEWSFREDAGLPPRMVYAGAAARVFAVNCNPHFETLNPDGEAHLPFMNLFQNLTMRHHSHASVIIDVAPILESFLNTSTLLLVAPGDYITMQYGDEDLNPLAPADIQTDFFVVAFALN